MLAAYLYIYIHIYYPLYTSYGCYENNDIANLSTLNMHVLYVLIMICHALSKTCPEGLS